jgi:MerR family mercuric resistance operon transcriptional regulator
MKLAKGLSIGALSKSTGVNIETIPYDEKIGLMPAPERTAGGYRSYREDHVKRLNFIRPGRELGFSPADVRGLLQLVDGHAYTSAQMRALTLQHLAKTRRKIADLRRLERVMSETAAKCRGRRIPDCPIIDAPFETRPRRGGGREVRTAGLP